MALKGRIALSNFSTGRDATYQILKGTGGIFVEGNNVAEVFIYLPTLSIVSFVSATYKRNSMSIGLRAQLKDVNNGDVGPSSHILWDDPTSETVNTWQTRSTTLAPGHHPSIVDHVAFQAGWNFGKGWLDDLIVEYKPGDLNANRNTGESDCDIARTGTSSVGNPIEVRGGEKREHIVDLQVNSPGAPLTFERRYRHTKRDDFDQMGLGWIHNHLIELIPPQSGEIMVQIATGGEAYFTETDPVNNPDHYDGVAGVDSFIDWDGVAQEYRLETPARNIYVFDSAGKLLSRTFANGEVWRYNYDGNDRLSEVADDYSRKLIFSYYSGLIGADAFKNDQLWRVGDHTASGLNGGSPSGRYIEFDYVSEKDDGVEVTTPRALLSSVADVRGEGWLYDYYGQDSGENDSNLLNILTRRESPDVDVTGNGNNDGVITLEEIAYTLNVGGVITDINQKRGGNLLETDFAFQPNGDNLTTESVAGQVTTHHFQGEVFAGSELPGANGAFATQIQNTTYRPFSNTDANGNATLLGWDTNGKLLDWIIDPLGNQIVFEYDTDERLTTSTDAEGRKTAYTYGDINNPRQPTQIDVLDVDGITLLRRQTFSYDTKGRVLSEKTLDPADGITVLQEVTRTYYTVGDGNGLLHQVTQKDIGGTNDVTTTFTYDSAGRVIKTQQNSNFGSCDVAFTVYDPAGNVLASICNYDPGLNPDPTTAAEAAALYDPSQPDKNRVTTHAYDSLGRRVSTTINAASNTEQTILTLYDALDRVIRTISNYKVQGTSAPGDWVFENGAWKTGPGGATISHGADETENIISDTDYNDRGFVRLQRDVLGNATLFGYDAAGRLIKTVQNASQPAYNNDYSGTSPDPELANYNPNANAAQDIITHNVYDPAGNLVKTIDPLGMAAIEAGTIADAAGHVSYTLYDALNRPVKTIRNASDPGITIDDVPDLVNYTLSVDPDHDLVDETVYDSMGRVVSTRRLLDNRQSEVWVENRNVYDALGRQKFTISNYVPQGASDPADWEWNATLAQWEDGAGNPINHGVNNDQNIIRETIYDASGRVDQTRDVLGSLNQSVYDGLGRQVLSIANFTDPVGPPSGWNWDAVIDNQWEDGVGTAVTFGNNDENIIAQTVYDADGRVQSIRDVLGRRTFFVYDAVGRRVKTITNYVPQGVSDPANWVWNATLSRWEDGAGTAIAHGSNDAENNISLTVYDADGRIQSTFDTRHNETRFVYDLLGRRVMTISNYVAQGVTDPADWIWDAVQGQWEDGANNAISHGTDNDQNQISTTTYDIAGRVSATRDSAGIETRFEYDALGRRIKTIANYVDGVFAAANPDEDLISQTTYNKAGQVVTTTDARGTATDFSYDAAGRRRTVTQAAGTGLASTSYTVYDKAGRVQRSIQNYVAILDALGMPISPDAQDEQGSWLFDPETHGTGNDRNLITTFEYDKAGRRLKVIDPEGNVTETSYFLDGQVDTITDPESMATVYRYDQLRRRTRVVQGFVGNGEDPSLWGWSGTQWEQSDTTTIVHGANNDQNIIVDVEYDLAGRMTQLRDPRGNLTSFEYDALNRRTKLTNPLSNVWTTAYENVLADGATKTTLTDPKLVATTRTFDRLGRLSTLGYGDANATPDVAFSYDLAGNRTRMTESNTTATIRETTYNYDAVRRLTSVGFDNDGDSIIDETVSYEYDAGGLRTKLTMPGNLSITYVYDDKGQLVSLTDWDGQQTRFAHDGAGRHVLTERGNGLDSRYRYDTAGRLRRLTHGSASKTLADFQYIVDGRGNRTQATELLMHPATIGDITLLFDDPTVVYKGSWSDALPFKETTRFSDSLKLVFAGDEVTFTYGTGPDHSIFDVYIGETFYQAYDGYSATAGEQSVTINLKGEGPHLFEIRNRNEQNLSSTGLKLRFKQVVMPDVSYDLHTIEYSYDALSRLLTADYFDGENVAGNPFREYAFAYDLAGNRLSESVTLNGAAPTVTNFTYNAGNQLTGDGTFTYLYDDNGNLDEKKQGMTTVDDYLWDRANRLASVGNHSYKYDGLGHRFQQTVSSVITNYLLDLQPGLAVVLSADDGTNTERFIHAQRGILARENNVGNWFWTVQDALGSVRGEVDSNVDVQGTRQFAPYGSEFGLQGSVDTVFGFTGEQTDGNSQVYLRARYYNPSIGVFANLDPIETSNRYRYVNSNPVNLTDPSGKVPILHSLLNNSCNAAAMIIPALFQTTPQDENLCGFPARSRFENTEEVVRLIAATGFQQNRFVGYEAMILTMVAAMNILDAGGSTLTGLQQSQHIYSHAGCNTAAVDACIDANNAVGLARQRHRNGEISDDELNRIIAERDTICSAVNQVELYTCVSGYFDTALQGGEPFPENSADLAKQAVLGARRLIAGRCLHGDSSFFFQAGILAGMEIAGKISRIDANDGMRFVFSFDSSWLDEIDTWAECFQNRNGRELEFVVVPPASNASNPNRAVFISSDFSPLCGAWQESKDNNPAVENPAVCGCDFSG